MLGSNAPAALETFGMGFFLRTWDHARQFQRADIGASDE